MKKLYFTVENDGFYGVYFDNKHKTDKVIILMLLMTEWLYPMFNGCSVWAAMQ